MNVAWFDFIGIGLQLLGVAGLAWYSYGRLWAPKSVFLDNTAWVGVLPHGDQPLEERVAALELRAADTERAIRHVHREFVEDAATSQMKQIESERRANTAAIVSGGAVLLGLIVQLVGTFV